MQTLNTETQTPIITINDESDLPIVAQVVRDIDAKMEKLTSDKKYLQAQEVVNSVNSEVTALKKQRTTFLTGLQDTGVKFFQKWLKTAKSKTKSATLHGVKLSLRASGSKFAINDEAKALKFFEEKYPHAVVVVKEVQISKLSKEERADLEAMKLTVTRKHGFEFTLPTETFNIEVPKP